MTAAVRATRARLPIQAKMGVYLCDLYSTMLAAAISFLPALYVFIAPQAERFGLTYRSAAVLWLFIAMILLNEWWHNRTVYFRHDMNFNGLGFITSTGVTCIYACVVSMAMLALVALPAAVTYRAFTDGGVPVAAGCEGACELTGYSLLRPIVWLLIIHHGFAIAATVLKALLPSTRQLHSLGAQVIADVVRPFSYWMYIFIASSHDSFLVGIGWIAGTYVTGVLAQWWAISQHKRSETTVAIVERLEDELDATRRELAEVRQECDEKTRTLSEMLESQDEPGENGEDGE